MSEIASAPAISSNIHTLAVHKDPDFIITISNSTAIISSPLASFSSPPSLLPLALQGLAPDVERMHSIMSSVANKEVGWCLVIVSFFCRLCSVMT